MSFTLITSEVPEPPPKRIHQPGRFVPLFEEARAAKGQWIMVQASDDEKRNRLANLASRIRNGDVVGATAGEFEVRTKSGEGRLWIRSVRRPMLKPR